jgi:general secretion pathway protein C
MSRPWYVRRELELALLAMSTALAVFGVNAAVRLAFDDVPAATPLSALPRAATREPLDAWAPIATRDLFNGDAAAPASVDAKRRLVGVGFQGGEARAAIEDVRTHRQDLVSVGDTVGDARVTSIAWDHVILTGGRGETVLELATAATDHPGEPDVQPDADDAPPRTASAGNATIRQTSPTAFVVDRRELAGAVDDMSGLMTQLRAVAEVQDGRPAGFRLFRMQDDSLFRRLGLQNGDVVQRVNGQAVSDPANLLAFLQRLRTEPRVALDIRRGAERRTMVYDLR